MIFFPSDDICFVGKNSVSSDEVSLCAIANGGAKRHGEDLPAQPAEVQQLMEGVVREGQPCTVSKTATLTTPWTQVGWAKDLRAGENPTSTTKQR